MRKYYARDVTRTFNATKVIYKDNENYNFVYYSGHLSFIEAVDKLFYENIEFSTVDKIVHCKIQCKMPINKFIRHSTVELISTEYEIKRS